MDAAEIRANGARIAAESLLDDPLTSFDRDIIGANSVQIRVPLRDPQQVKVALQILARTIEECILHIDRGGLKDRSVLFDVRGRIHLANKKVNAYRKIRSL